MATARGARTAFIQGERMIDQARPQRFAELQTGYDTARNDIGSGMGTLNNLVNRYNTGSQMYSNALGLNGSQGNEQAQQAYQTSPGYQFALDQGVKARERAASRMGGLNSGGLLSELTSYGTGVAQQDYGNWLNRLQGFDSLAMQGGAQQAQGGRDLAGLSTGYYGNRSNIIGEDTNNKVGLFAGAMKATDAARNQNEANLIGGLSSLAGLFGNVAGGAGGLGRLFGGGANLAQPRILSGSGGLY